jgi:hypothetical protein
VLAYDPATGKPSTQTVQHVWINHDHDLLDVALRLDTPPSQDAAHDKAQRVATKAHGSQAPPSDETIHTTDNHPWLTADRGWVPAGELRLGERVVRLDGTTAAVVALTVRPGVADYYNLTVSVVHTYAVGAGQFVVHNCDSAKLGKNLVDSSEAKPIGVDAQAHHIVPCGSPKASFAQSVLAKHGIDIDSAVNGVWLSQKGHTATFLSRPGSSYYDWLNQAIDYADTSGGKQGVLDFLSDTKQQLNTVDQWVRSENY